MSDSSLLTGLTNSGEEVDVAVSVDGDELRALEQALLAIEGESQAASAILSAIARAASTGRPLLLGASEGIGPSDQAQATARILALVDRLMPDLEIPSEAAAVLSRRNAKRRSELLQEFGALTGEQIADERSRASNRHALAARWRKEGKIFGVPYRNQTLYPAFQFDDEGRPLDQVARVLEALPREQLSEWEVAYWWTAANGWLDGTRPVDVFEIDPDAVVHAARQLREPLPL